MATSVVVARTKPYGLEELVEVRQVVWTDVRPPAALLEAVA